MASINNVVSIQITANNRNPTQPGFGKPAFLTFTTVFPERWRDYASLAEMTADGFSTGSNAYRFAASTWNQDPSVALVRIVRVDSVAAFSQTVEITSAVEGQHVRMKVVDSTGAVQQLDYPIPASATTTTVAVGVEALLEAIVGVASVPTAATIAVTPDSANGYQPFIYDLQNANIYETTPLQAAYVAALDDLETDNNDFYFIEADTVSQANVNPIAAWALARKNTNPKLYFVGTQDSRELTSGGTLGSTLMGLSNDRTAVLYTRNRHEFAEAAWVGAKAPKTPGSVNWANSPLVGVTAKDLTSTQEGFLTAHNVNNYQIIAGYGAVRPGVVASGEWIDIVHGTDALKADMQASVWGAIANNDKIGWTDAELDLIAAQMVAVLKRWEDAKLLVPGESRVRMPKAADISAADKRARRLRGVPFSGKYRGAVNTVGLVGTLDY